MICKPSGEKKSEVCFTQLLSELNSNVLHYQNLLLCICVCVCTSENKDIASYNLEIFPSQAASKPDCTLYKFKLSTLPPLCFLSLIYPSTACLAVEFLVWFLSCAGLQPVSHLQYGQKSLESDVFAENHLAKLMALQFLCHVCRSVFPSPSQVDEQDFKTFLEIT